MSLELVTQSFPGGLVASSSSSYFPERLNVVVIVNLDSIDSLIQGLQVHLGMAKKGREGQMTMVPLLFYTTKAKNSNLIHLSSFFR